MLRIEARFPRLYFWTRTVRTGGCIIKVTSNKRARAKAQTDRRKQKEQKRLEAKERKATAPPRPDDEDPDIAGIVAGPQPLPDWFPEEEEEEEQKQE